MTVVLTDKVNGGLGKAMNIDNKCYELTNPQSIETCTEKEAFNNDLFYRRLADEAAAHNVAVNVVGLPFNF